MSFQLPEVGKDRGEWGGILNATLTWLKNQVASVQSAVSGKADVEHDHDERYYTADQVDAELLNKADSGHDHDDRYYTETEVDALLGDLEVGAGLDDEDIAGLVGDTDSATRTALDSLLSEGYAPVEHFHDEQYSQLGHNHDGDYAALDHNHDDRYVRTVNNTAPDENGNVTVDAGGGGGVTDHGALTGLEDDDHPQYLTEGRGDARYYTQGALDAILADKAEVEHTHVAEDVSDSTEVGRAVLTAEDAAEARAALGAADAGHILGQVAVPCRWDESTHSWPARPTIPAAGGGYVPVAAGLVDYVSTHDANATAPTDAELGDKWSRHPDAAPLGAE